MTRLIAIVSPLLPSEAQIPLKLNANTSVLWFNEIEAAFIYFIHNTCHELILDESILKQPESCLLKYKKRIAEMQPLLVINSHYFKKSPSDNKLEKCSFFPSLERIFKNGELTSLFQPIVKVQHDHIAIAGYECLSRLQYYGTRFPPEFIFDYAQEKLALTNYDKICLMQALRLAPKKKNNNIFVNVRPQTVISNNFNLWLKDELKKNQLDPDNIILEITEQHGIMCEREVKEQCVQLKSQGFRIAIDDFGTGISNLSMIETLDPNYIKISGRFVKGCQVSETKKKIIKNILSLAADLSISAVVENVENQEEWQLAHSLGCNMAQGYHFYHPLSDDKLAALL